MFIRSLQSGLTIKALIEKGVLHLFSASLLNYVLQFGSSLLVAAFLSPADLGEMRVLQAYILIFSLAANGGASTAVLKYCSEPGSMLHKNALLTMALRRAAVSTSIAICALVGLTLLGLTVKSRESYVHLFLYATVIPFSVLIEILTFYMHAAKRFRDLAAAQTINRLLSVCVIALGTKAWGLLGFLISFTLAQASGLVPLIRASKGIIALVKPAKPPGGFTKTAIFSALANGTALLGLYADMFVLDRFGVARSIIGRYSLASLVVLGASVLTYTTMAVLTPYFSEHGRDPEWIRKQLIVNQARVTLLSILTAAGGYLLAVILIRFVYGPVYADSLVYLRVLLIKHVLWSSQAVISVALLAMGLANYNFATVLCATSVCIVVSCLGFPRFGVPAVAAGQVAGAVVALVIGVGLTFKVLRQARIGALTQCESSL